jgi:hypothetical protein
MRPSFPNVPLSLFHIPHHLPSLSMAQTPKIMMRVGQVGVNGGSAAMTGFSPPSRPSPAREEGETPSEHIECRTPLRRKWVGGEHIAPVPPSSPSPTRMEGARPPPCAPFSGSLLKCARPCGRTRKLHSNRESMHPEAPDQGIQGIRLPADPMAPVVVPFNWAFVAARLHKNYSTGWVACPVCV